MRKKFEIKDIKTLKLPLKCFIHQKEHNLDFNSLLIFHKQPLHSDHTTQCDLKAIDK